MASMPINVIIVLFVASTNMLTNVKHDDAAAPQIDNHSTRRNFESLNCVDIIHLPQQTYYPARVGAQSHCYRNANATC
jgi:hypothetical protein